MRIRLRIEGPLIVPIAYHALLQQALYTLVPAEVVQDWRRVRGVRPFTFSRLLGRMQQKPEHTIAFAGPIDWWISLRRAEDMRALLDRIAANAVLVLADQRRDIIGVAVEPPFVWTRTLMGITTLSPIVADDNINGHIISYGPDEPLFQDHIAHNAEIKAQQFLGHAAGPLAIYPLEAVRVRSWYGTTPVVGYRGRFLLAGDPDLLTLLYDVGVGRRNGLGFGCCDAFLPTSAHEAIAHA